jgi:hypothetical protein
MRKPRRRMPSAMFPPRDTIHSQTSGSLSWSGLVFTSLGCVFGIVFCFLILIDPLSLLLLFLLSIALFGRFFWKRRRSHTRSRGDVVALGFACGVLLRIILVFSILLICYHSDGCFRLTARVLKVQGYSSFCVFGHTLGLWEYIYDHYDQETRTLLRIHAHAGTVDPFSGEPFKCSRDGVYYSVGPDFSDNRALIPYDCTNGIGSCGDIVVEPRADHRDRVVE